MLEERVDGVEGEKWDWRRRVAAREDFIVGWRWVGWSCAADKYIVRFVIIQRSGASRIVG